MHHGNFRYGHHGGRGDYTMHFLRYEEVPTHVAQKIIEQTKKEREEAKV
jgi:elongation factor G